MQKCFFFLLVWEPRTTATYIRLWGKSADPCTTTETHTLKKIFVFQLEELLPFSKRGHAASTTVTNTQWQKQQSGSSAFFSVLKPRTGHWSFSSVALTQQWTEHVSRKSKDHNTWHQQTDNVSEGAISCLFTLWKTLINLNQDHGATNLWISDSGGSSSVGGLAPQKGVCILSTLVPGPYHMAGRVCRCGLAWRQLLDAACKCL